MADIQSAISEGSVSFLVTEYKYMGVFMVRGSRKLSHHPEHGTCGSDQCVIACR